MKKKFFIRLKRVNIFIVAFFNITLSTIVVGDNYSPLDGNIVFAPLASTTTYMIDESGGIRHSWDTNYIPGLSVYWVPDDSVYRAVLVPGGIGGQGGGVQKIASDNTILWEFIYDNETVCAHHDIAPLPNGNVLLLAYEVKTEAETIQAGRNPQYVWNQLLVEHIIEVKPTGPSTGDIVWEWHVWDHLIQDYDATKDNYGSVFNHPELVDVNYGSTIGYDWLHANSLDYNERLDQILISIRNFNEIWVVDHSTSAEQAASHNGGRYGKGGDILYRWGNPEAYNRGTSLNKKFFWQHDAKWVNDGYPGSGNILVFNNGVGRGYSSVDEIIPPIDSLGNYILIQGQSFGPICSVWSYTSDPPEDFFAYHLSGEERLPNGNTLILQGESGKFFVVTPNNTEVWTYYYFVPPPVGVISVPFFVPDSPPIHSDLDTEGSLQWDSIKPGDKVIGSFQIRNIGVGRVNWSINVSSISWGNWTITPSSGFVDDNVTAVNVILIVPNEENSEFEGYIRVQNADNPIDFELVPVILTTASNLTPIFHNEIQALFYNIHKFYKLTEKI
jgi:hypothetical protein